MHCFKTSRLIIKSPKLLSPNLQLTSFVQTFRFQLDRGIDLNLLYPTKFW